VDQQKLEQQIATEHKVEAAKEKVLGKMHEETQNHKDVDAITGGLLDTEKRNQELIHSHIAEEHKRAAQRTQIAQAATAQKMKDEISSITASASPNARTHFDLSVHNVKALHAGCQDILCEYMYTYTHTISLGIYIYIYIYNI
jgi:hypothetical protein